MVDLTHTVHFDDGGNFGVQPWLATKSLTRLGACYLHTYKGLFELVQRPEPSYTVDLFPTKADDQ